MTKMLAFWARWNYISYADVQVVHHVDHDLALTDRVRQHLHSDQPPVRVRGLASLLL